MFKKLIKTLNRFQITEQIFDEKELETKLATFLRDNDYQIKTQDRISPEFRNDIVVMINEQKICIELKVYANLSCMKQLDDYLPFYKDGIILLCWKASQNVKIVFDRVKQSIKTPIELIEVRKNNSMI